ncbi:MAG: Clp protease ClpP [Pseudotabrizicola sp.]|uniref:head maturation protease, ClpP-related n=1 Tax=Pseudotabrizicola sp. TaxID=2939647 RepID=UPI002716F47D|nr:head maturation protease, ClpP-related [Pseudotabrizicola sp.]MDO9639166.1 Clp protease ClpP [Pseudotabrizicola sp.]
MNTLYLYGSVGESCFGEEFFTPSTVRDNLAGMPGPITVRINSGGGFATYGQTIYNLLRSHNGEKHVIIDGLAASAASLIAMAGDRITMLDGSILMIHDPATDYVEGRGTEDEHRRTADSLALCANAYAVIYAKRAGITFEAAREIMRAETYFDGAAALAAGFCDDLDDEQAAEPSAFDLSLLHNAPQRLVALARNNGWATASPDETDRSFDMLDHNGRKAPSAQLQAKVLASIRGKGNKAANAEMLTAFFPLMVEGVHPGTQATLFQRIKDLVDATGKADDLADIVLEIATQLFGEQDPEDDEQEDTPAQAKAKGLLLNAALQKAVEVVVAREAQEQPLTRHIRNNTPWNRFGGQDQGTTMRIGMTSALVARMTGAKQVSGPAQQYMGMSFPEMVATHIGHRGSLRTAGDRQRVIEMGLGSHSTSDFPAVFENALNKSLRNSYDAAPSSYRLIADERPFRDFRPHSVVGVGDFPMLERVSETGEIKAGTISESKESLLLLAYAKQFRLSRQMLIDDDLGVVDRILSERGRAVAAFEDKIFYEMMLSGAGGDGPTLLQTGRQVFNTTDLSKAGTAAALSLTSLGAAWAPLRKRKSLDGEDLELTPAILLVGPDKELEALQLVADITANESGKVNPFAGKLQVVVTAKITGNAWYVFADPSAAPCFVYGFLEGEEGPRMRMDEPFGQQGMAWSVELDFGCGAIDFRGGFKNAGA